MQLLLPWPPSSVGRQREARVRKGWGEGQQDVLWTLSLT